MSGAAEAASREPARALRRAAAVCSAIALVVSAFLWWRETQGLRMPGCDGVTACSAVLASRWSRWATLPIALLGTSCYLAMSLGLTVWERVNDRGVRRVLWGIMTMQSITGIGFVTWLTALQAFAVRQFCLYCMSAHTAGLLAFVLILAGTRRATGLGPFRKRFAGPGLAVLGGLITLHLATAEETAVPQMDPAVAASAPAVASSPGIRIGKPATSRTVTLMDGNLTFDLDQVPLVGDAQAELVALDLFDYQCPSCRDLHGKLHGYLEERKTRLALIVLPVPMEASCNESLKNTLRMFDGSCTYARLAMAVQAAAPAAFPGYHSWLLEGTSAPELDEARRRAEELLGGAEELVVALADPRVEQWIKDGLAIHAFTGGRTILKFITARNVMRYSGGSKSPLHRSLDEALGLPSP